MPTDRAELVGAQFIGQWNWGAACWYPYWLMTHRRVRLGIIWLIIALIPIVDIATLGAIVYFGLYGNRIAVLSGRFTDEQTFVAVQNAWRNWAFGITIVGALAYFAAIAFRGAR